MFTTHFDKYLCVGDTITTQLDGYEFTARVEYDDDYNIDSDDKFNTKLWVTAYNDIQKKQILDDEHAWFNNKWFYGFISIHASFNGVSLPIFVSLGGLEINLRDSNKYLLDVANELLPEAIEEAKKARLELIEKLTK